MKHLDLCSGTGGFALGLRWSGGYDTVAFAEIDDFASQILKQHWPAVKNLGDITDDGFTDKLAEAASSIDVLTAGFPCQPFSQQGSRQGQDDERYLWPELIRVIRCVRPGYIILENVAGLLSMPEFGIILGQLAESGYDAEWQVLPASAFGAPHKRDRVWVVAYHSGERIQGVFPQTLSQQPRIPWFENVRGLEDIRDRSDLFGPPLCRTRNGIPHYVDRIKALGNSIVPHIAWYLGDLIKQHSGVRSTAS